jgi:hypothetical protein
MMSEYDTIVLEREHIKFADWVALRRMEEAIEQDREPGNGAPTDYNTALKFDVLGARCEAAAKIYLNPVKWNYLAKKISGLADLEDWIDVKGRSESWQDLMVQRNCKPNWAYLLVRGHDHPSYEIVGWCWGYEAMETPVTDPAKGRPARFISEKAPIIKPPKSLFAEVRDRQRLDALAREWV